MMRPLPSTGSHFHRDAEQFRVSLLVRAKDVFPDVGILFCAFATSVSQMTASTAST